MTEIKIFTTPNCAWCHRAKGFLRGKGVSFDEYDISENDEARTEILARTGQLSVPVMEINGTLVVGYNETQITNALLA